MLFTLQAKKRFNVVLDLCARNRADMAAVVDSNTRRDVRFCWSFSIPSMHPAHAV